jgi:hypothetical protein
MLTETAISRISGKSGQHNEQLSESINSRHGLQNQSGNHQFDGAIRRKPDSECRLQAG